MITNLAKRLLSMVPVLLAVTFLLYALMALVPGDAAEAMLGPYATPDNVAALRQEMNLDAPFPVRYGSWLGQLFQGNFGRAYSLDRPVLDEILERFSATLILAGAALLVCTVFGLGAGIYLAIRRRGVGEKLLTSATLIGISMPSFWMGLLLILVFSVQLQWLPAGGMRSVFGDGGLWDLFRHLLLPAVTLGTVAAAVTARLARAQMLDVLDEGYIRTARAKGLRGSQIIGKHAFVNALIGVIPVLGLQAGYVLGGAVYIETIFQWPGIGRMLVQAIQARDLLLVQGGVLLVGVSYLVINLMTDLLQHWLDPRLRP